jgi:PAS domain S-box-containing protein
MDALNSLTPHGFCLAWEPGLIWLHAVSDALIACAYYSIPVALLVLVRRRRDLAFPWIFRLFATFILACGTTHIMAVVTLWEPLYWLDGTIKALTAVVSLVTAVILWPLLPQAVALPSPAALRASEERQRAIYRGTPAALHALDLQGCVIEVSDHWLNLFGYAREDVVGRPISVVDADWRGAPDDAAAWQQLLRDGGARDMERRFRCKDGSQRDVLISATLERDASGGVRQIMAAVTDITARRQAEAALRASEERLRQAQKMEAVGQLTGGIAHDFNNTLTGIMGSLELLRRRMPKEPGVTRLLDGATAAANRAARLTGQLLSFSRRQHLHPEILDPAVVIEEMRELLARTLGERITLNIEAPAQPGLLCEVDRNQLESALLNLTLNARAAISPPGEVRIQVTERWLEVDEAALLAVARDDEPPPAGHYVVVAVCDTGHGMTEDVRRRAIEPFFTTKGVGEGTGLGLSQTYGFLRQSGGTLAIESAPGQGTRVEMLLPRERPAHGHGEHILVVEDEPGLADLVAAALRENGYVVSTATDAVLGLQLLERAADVRALFTDMLIPGRLNGVEFALQARKLRPGLPVIFATGHISDSLLASWPEPPVILDKPYSMAALLSQLAATLDVARQTRAAAD